MNIQQIIVEGLRQQLYYHEFVVLPGFGGFVLKQRPAHFSATGMQLMAPSRTVGFNAQLRQNDGILSSWLQKKLNINAAETLVHLNEFASYCQSVLNHKRRLTIPGIGFFHVDLENKLNFEPLADQNFNLESFGLCSIYTEQLREKDIPLVRRAVVEDRRIRTIPEKKFTVSKSLLPMLAGAILLLSLTMLVSVSNFKGPLKSALWQGNTLPAYSPPSKEITLVSADTADIIREAGAELILNVGSSGWRIIGNNETYSEEKFEIVLGCFSKEKNAYKLIKKLQRRDLSAHLSKRNHKGMFVVIYDGYADRAGALQDLVRAQTVVSAAWIREL